MSRQGARFVRAIGGFLALVALGACSTSSKEKLVAPKVTIAPYEGGEPLWAVVPLRNESGTSLAEELAVSDAIVQAVEEVRGVRCVPLNRTMDAMRALSMPEPRTPGDLERLAATMGVDAVVVGSITDFDPYSPPVLGLALAVYARPRTLGTRGGALDPKELTSQPTDYKYFTRSNFDDAPVTVVSELMDARNHDVLMRVKEYASGRHEQATSFGWRRYTASMDLYTAFGAWHTVGRLMDQEWVRLAGAEPMEGP